MLIFKEILNFIIFTSIKTINTALPYKVPLVLNNKIIVIMQN